MTDTTPAAIEALLKDVTPGPCVASNNPGDWGLGGNWTVSVAPHDYDAIIAEIPYQTPYVLGEKLSVRDRASAARANARFIAWCFNNVPALAAERDAAMRERDEARKETADVRREAEKCFGAQEEVDEAWAAIGTRGNRNHLSLSEQLSSLFREEDSRAEKAETEAAAWRIAVMKLTPGGSEYTNPEAVISFVEREREDRHEARAEKAKAVREAAALRKEVEQLREAFSDPIAVHANMLRGAITMPSVENIIHIYGAEALRAALTSKGGEG